MKNFIVTIAIALLTGELLASPPPIVLTISPLPNGYYQIIAPGNTILGGTDAYCVLQSSTDFVAWTSISTNMFPYSTGYGRSGYGYAVTDVVYMTNSIMFYRVKAYGGGYGAP